MDAAPLLAHLAELRRQPVPPDRRPVGCAGLLLSLAGILVFPLIAHPLGLDHPAWGRVALTVLGGLALVSLVMAVFASGGGYSAALARIEAAVAILTASNPDAPPVESEAFQRAAVALLADASFSNGPSTVETFRTEEMAERLGPALAGVQEVERLLLEAGAIYHVFTGSGAAPGATTEER